MPRGLPRAAKENLQKCHDAAIAAVDVYNRPGPRFRTAHFIVLIVLAWTAGFHAFFYKRSQKPWYTKKGNQPKGNRYVRVDGEPKHWELTECLRQFWGAENPPERKNLEFLIGLRNKIEHRSTPELDPGLYGECQASLMNLETFIVANFGDKHALMQQLAVSLQFGHVMPDEKRRAIKQASRGAAKSVREYVESFRSGLPYETLNSLKYSFSVFLVPKVANKRSAADAAVEFIKFSEANDEDLARMEKLNVLIKERHIPIANLDVYKPSQVKAKIQTRLSHRFSLNAHAAAWNFFQIRPPSGSSNPAATDSRYCVYDSAHADYLYTEAWIEKLVGELSDPVRFQEITGLAPVPK